MKVTPKVAIRVRVCHKSGGNTLFPCRRCLLTKDCLMSTQIDLIPRRESTDVIPYLTKAFAAYCKYSRKEALSEDDKTVLDFCYDNSLQPMLPSFFKLNIPFRGFSHYERFPFDLMHTFNGVLKKYVALTLLCIRKVSGLAK